jgi:putative oxidoreductase
MTDASSSTPRLLIPALGGLYSGLSNIAQAVLRIALGGILIPHGMQKLFGSFGGMGLEKNAALFDKIGYTPGMFWGTLVGCTELVGGILLVFGLLTRPAAFAVVIFMINGVYFTSKTGGFFWTSRGSEFAILILVVAFFVLVRGAGPWSLDRRIGREF